MLRYDNQGQIPQEKEESQAAEKVGKAAAAPACDRSVLLVNETIKT